MQSPVNNPTSYTTPPMRLYKGAVAFLSGIIKLVFRVKITGRENVPENGACFVCCNHISNWDPVLVAVAVHRPIFFMAKKELFSIPLVGGLVRALGAFPVDRESSDIGAIKTAFTHIKHGEQVGIFPEGRRYLGEAPGTHSIKSGTGMMTYRTQAPVLPVSVYTKDYRIGLFKKVHISIGKPIEFSEYNAGAKSPEEYQRISDFIFARICALNELSKKESQHE